MNKYQSSKLSVASIRSDFTVTLRRGGETRNIKTTLPQLSQKISDKVNRLHSDLLDWSSKFRDNLA